MSLFAIFQITSQGMTAQRERLEAASSNLANSNTTRTAEGGPYRRRDVVLETANVETGPATFGSLMLGARSDAAVGVSARAVVADDAEAVLRYQPGHPDANAEGYVRMPNVDPLEETVNMMSAARSFEANATAFNTAKEMARASLRLGDA